MHIVNGEVGGANDESSISLVMTSAKIMTKVTAIIEEQTGETFDWDAFFRAMKVYNQETEYELQKWEVNRTPYPQMTGETFWIYRMFFYHLSGGMDPHFLDTDRRVNRIMMRGYQQKKPCAPAMRHRCVEWSCPANFYPDFSVWAENCWGINVVASMESLISDIIIDTEDPDRALADLARSYQRTTMRKHTKGGYANVLDELWVVCKQYNADMVLMYDQISCKGMDGLRGVFEEQAAARGVHMLWVAQDLLDFAHNAAQRQIGRIDSVCHIFDVSAFYHNSMAVDDTVSRSFFEALSY